MLRGPLKREWESLGGDPAEIDAYRDGTTLTAHVEEWRERIKERREEISE